MIPSKLQELTVPLKFTTRFHCVRTAAEWLAFSRLFAFPKLKITEGFDDISDIVLVYSP